MPSFLEDAARELSRGADHVADAIGDAAIAAGDAGGHVIKEGVRAFRRGVPGAIVGGLLGGPAGALALGGLGAFRGGRGGGRGDKGLTGARTPPLQGRAIIPMPRLPVPGYGRDGYCACSVDPKTGEMHGAGESFTFSSRLQFTGAQAVNTDLGDFFTTAATTDLVTNNQFPFDFDVDEAAITMGITYSTAVAATGTELASLLSLKLIERKYNSQEQYQLSVVELAPTVYYNGTLGTPTATAPAAAATIYQVQPENIYVPWGRRYKSTEQWQLVVRTPRAFTVVAAATFDLNVQLRGRRV